MWTRKQSRIIWLLLFITLIIIVLSGILLAWKLGFEVGRSDGYQSTQTEKEKGYGKNNAHNIPRAKYYTKVPQ